MGNEEIRHPTYGLNMRIEDSRFDRNKLKYLSTYHVFSGNHPFGSSFIKYFSGYLHTNNDVVTIVVHDEDIGNDDICLHLTTYGLYFDPIYTDIINIIINDLLTYLEEKLR